MEGLRHQAHLGAAEELVAVRGGYPGALLASVLEGKESKKGQARYVLVWSVDANNAAGFL
jgi:hypothetical protein